MKGKVSIGIIGAGRIGRLHARHLRRRIEAAEVIAVSDINTAAAVDCSAELGIPQSYRDYRDVLHNPDIDAVVICSSTDTHAEIIAEAAAAGKHIFCEKPIALNLAAIDSALQAVDEAGVKLQIGFNRRFDSEYRRIWEHLRAGTIGEPHLIHVISRDPAPPPIEYVKVSGGIFLDMMIHDFDMLRYLIGAEVEELHALGDVRVDPKIGAAGDVDTALVSVRFTNGVIGSIDNSRRAVYGYDQRVEVFGSGGMLRNENEAPNSVEVSTAQEISFDLPLNFFMDRYVNSYIAEMEAFIEAVLEDRPTSVTGRDGKIPVIMGMAAGKSLREKRPVRLEEIAPMPE